jgi:excisionase family DNA binding protein
LAVLEVTVKLKGNAMQDFIRVSEAAKLLGVRSETVRIWFDQGKLPGMRLPGNGERRICREAVLSIRNGGDIDGR